MRQAGSCICVAKDFCMKHSLWFGTSRTNRCLLCGCADRLKRINAQNEESRLKHAEEVDRHNEASSAAMAANQTWQANVWQMKASHSTECKRLKQLHDASCAELKAAWKSHKQLVDKDNAMAEATAKRRHAEKVATVKASNAEKREHHAKAQAVRPP